MSFRAHVLLVDDSIVPARPPGNRADGRGMQRGQGYLHRRRRRSFPNVYGIDMPTNELIAPPQRRVNRASIVADTLITDVDAMKVSSAL